MTDKEPVIRQIYYDKDDGFDSVINTYRKANKVLNSITVAVVKTFLDKQKSRQNKPYRGFNSYVSPKALHEFQIDIGDWTESASDNNGLRYMFLAVDPFSKYIHCVPIRDKKQQNQLEHSPKYSMLLVPQPKLCLIEKGHGNQPNLLDY